MEAAPAGGGRFGTRQSDQAESGKQREGGGGALDLSNEVHNFNLLIFYFVFSKRIAELPVSGESQPVNVWRRPVPNRECRLRQWRARDR